jgi:antitoxin HigA-1
MGMSTNRLNEIVKGKRSVTAETALLFAAITGTSGEFWMSLQANYDLWHALQKVKHIKRIAPGEPFPVREKA